MNPQYGTSSPRSFSGRWRLQILYGLLVAIFTIFLLRAFYLQVLRYEHYRVAAQSGQLKEYIIPAERGTIEAHDGDQLVPLVLNEKLYTLFADPKYITDPADYSLKLTAITGGDINGYIEAMKRPNTRYVVLAKKLPKDKKESIDNLKLKGIGTREAQYRTYPEGSLAAQLVGFVDAEGRGKYGVEQALQGELAGKEGLLKAITDASGVPLVSNSDNVQLDPKEGKKVVLTIDIAMQRKLEDILKQGLEYAKSPSGSVVVIDPQTGEIKAVTNYPTFNPADFAAEKNTSAFNNAAFSSAYEPGSVMKPLTVAAALQEGVVNSNTTFYDPGFFSVDGATITNVVESSGSGTRSLQDILRKSLNTGAVWLLRQMGGGDLNSKARDTWYDYMYNQYRFGHLTGVEGYEESGYVPDPKRSEGEGVNIQFANSSFGQGITMTPLQMAAALSSVINGGTYWQPRVIEKLVDGDGNTELRQPQALVKGIVSVDVSKTIRRLMSNVVETNNPKAARQGYEVGGKTGTAQIAKPGGGYYDDKFNGSYIGFVGGNQPNYVVVVRVNEPKIGGYAGTTAAGPIFASTVQMLINDFGIAPRNN